MPCHHVIAPMIIEKTPIQLEMIHQQWHLKEIVVEPVKKPTETLEIKCLLENLAAKVQTSVPNIQSSVLQQINDLIKSTALVVGAPEVVASCRCPKSGKKHASNSSTKCDLTLFKIMAPTEPFYNCSICGNSGHNARTCDRRQEGSKY